MLAAMEPEILLRPNPQRFSVFPIQYQDLWNVTKKSSSFFWLADLRDFAEDLDEWRITLDANKRSAIELVFGSFLNCDLFVNLKFVRGICEIIEATEAKMFFGNYIHNNMNQAEAYRIFLVNAKNADKNVLEKSDIFNKKLQWANNWFLQPSITFGEQIVAMIAMVTIFMAECYSVIMSLAKFKTMPSLLKLHENVLKDKQFLLHFCFLLWKYVSNKPSESRIVEIIDQAIELEHEVMVRLFINSKVLFCSHSEISKGFSMLKDAVLHSIQLLEVFDLKKSIVGTKIELGVPSKILPRIPQRPGKMHVIKRNGKEQDVYFDKIMSRINKLCYGLNMDFIDPGLITKFVIRNLKNGIRTCELDDISAEFAAKLVNEYPQYEILAARIAISNLHKETTKQFSEVIEQMYKEQTATGRYTINPTHYVIIMENSEILNSCIIYDRDFDFSYENFQILVEKYLFRNLEGCVIERPQQMFMRTAIGIHGNDINSIIRTYNLMSEKCVMFSPSILRSACIEGASAVSSYTLAMRSDNIEGIFNSIEDLQVVVDEGVSVGFNMQCIRAKRSLIRGTNGTSNGIVPLLRNFNEIVVQPDSCTVYLEIWHSDLFDFLELKHSSGIEEMHATNLNYALWVPDLFMKRLENDQMWSFMCPNECKNLLSTWGDEFEKLYLQYENNGNHRFQKPAKEVMKAIISSQADTGYPCILFKDTCNRKSNHQNIGTIQGANFSGDVIQFSSNDMIGATLQAAILLSQFVKDNKFDFVELKSAVKHVTKSLDLLIDQSSYSLSEAEMSALKTRSIGIGVQGLADVFILLQCSFDSEQAKDLNRKIFETIYFGALETSCELASALGQYDYYDASPISRNQLQFDFWDENYSSDLWDWSALRKQIAIFGVRNSLLISLMDENEIYQIFGNSPSVQPLNSILCERIFKKEKFNVINRHLIHNLSEMKLWTKDIREKILQSGGSIQNVKGVPDNLKEIYKTVWEIPNDTLIGMSADRCMFVDQSESVRLYVTDSNELDSYYLAAWRKGLKTAMSRIQFKVES